MPRRNRPPRRPIAPDPRYQAALVTRLVHRIMYSGKKAVAERIVYGAFDIMAEKSGEDPVRLFKKALDNVKPQLEVKSRRVGGSNYQVPVEVRSNRKTALGMRWLISYARARGEKTMIDKLAGELLDASSNRGAAVKKRDDTHRMAEANKAFAHYRW